MGKGKPPAGRAGTAQGGLSGVGAPPPAGKAKAKTRPRPVMGSEEEIQAMVFGWARLMEHTHPELCVLYAVPNAAKRSYYQGARMRKAGLRAGVPDMCLPVRRGEYSGLYIELKRGPEEPASPAQKLWIRKLRKHGNYACICRGYEASIACLSWYLTLK